MTKELKLLNLLTEQSDYSQRQLSKLLDVSLGTVNNMIQTFEDEGVLKVVKHTARKVDYVLTTDGQEYKNRLHVEHISECFDTIASVRSTFKQNLAGLVDQGKTNFIVQGQTDELVRLVKMCFFEISRKKKVDYTLYNELKPEDRDQVVLGGHNDYSMVVGWTMEPEDTLSGLNYKNLLS